MPSRQNYLITFILICLSLESGATDDMVPFADSHIHYNWDQAEIISVQTVVDKLKQENVGLTLVSSTPSHLALELRKAGGNWIVPFFSPYTHELGKRDWFRDKTVINKARQGLDQGLYFGIGEIHFMGGFLPRRDNTVFYQLMVLARQYQVPALIHVDSANEKYFLSICKEHSEVRIIFGHAGGNLYPSHIRSVLEQCPDVWIDFAARDDWRYGGLTDNKGILLPEWKRLVLDYPNRFITGADPVWRVTRTQSWDASDDGWDYYGKLLNYHRTWLADLPKEVSNKIAWKNVLELLNQPEESILIQ